MLLILLFSINNLKFAVAVDRYFTVRSDLLKRTATTFFRYENDKKTINIQINRYNGI